MMKKKYFKHLHLKAYLEFFYFSTEAALVGLIAYLLGSMLSVSVRQVMPQMGGMWCAISALVVLQSFFQATKRAGFERILGSCMGAVSSGFICQNFGYGYGQLLASIFIVVYIMNLLNAEPATRLGSTTAAVIVINGLMHPAEQAWLNAFMRFIEGILGVSIAFIIVMLGEKLGFRIFHHTKE